MHVCNYCGRVLKYDYEKCPGCGGSSFKNKAYLGEEVIKEPPKDGYKINVENYKRKMRNANITSIIGIILVVVPLLWSLPLLLIGIVGMLLFFPFEIIIGIILIIVGNKIKRQTKKEMKRATKLAKKGILVKNMPYEAAPTGTFVGSKVYKCIKVNYKNSAGVEIPLFSETKFDIDEKMKSDDTADLLIDPDDYSNYFIDFEIY